MPEKQNLMLFDMLRAQKKERWKDVGRIRKLVISLKACFVKAGLILSVLESLSFST